MAVDLKNHPGANPDYNRIMEIRRLRIEMNWGSMLNLPVPKQPNKYVPHIGAKQRAKGAAK